MFLPLTFCFKFLTRAAVSLQTEVQVFPQIRASSLSKWKWKLSLCSTRPSEARHHFHVRPSFNYVPRSFRNLPWALRPLQPGAGRLASTNRQAFFTLRVPYQSGELTFDLTGNSHTDLYLGIQLDAAALLCSITFFVLPFAWVGERFIPTPFPFQDLPYQTTQR